MLRSEDERWLREAHPRLDSDARGIAGNIAFTATYNAQLDYFLNLSEGVADTVGGVVLSGDFSIRIEERSDKTLSALPALFVDGVDPTPDRHFVQADKSACLCSPLEEDEFLRPEFQFVLFMEKLVIPFLYGQVFYSQAQRWPWAEYAHGSAGLLEAYAKNPEPMRAEDCLRRLVQDGTVWPRLRTALQGKSNIKGHTPCFCPAMDQIRRCHPAAWRGALQLQRDIRVRAIDLP